MLLASNEQYTLQVIADVSPDSPRNNENLWRLAMKHHGDEQYDSPRDFLDEVAFELSPDGTWFSDVQDMPVKAKSHLIHSKSLCFPLYMLQHGDVNISTEPFSCKFDAGFAGFAYVTKADILSAFGRFTSKRRKPKRKHYEAAVMALYSELRSYVAYLNGYCYGFRLFNAKGEEIDSCWGFYGSDFESNGMADNLPADALMLLRELKEVPSDAL